MNGVVDLLLKGDFVHHVNRNAVSMILLHAALNRCIALEEEFRLVLQQSKNTGGAVVGYTGDRAGSVVHEAIE